MDTTPKPKSRFTAFMEDLHGNSSIWYGYFMAIAVTINSSNTEINDYVPLKWRHWIMLFASAMFFIDKVKRSVQATAPPT